MALRPTLLLLALIIIAALTLARASLAAAASTSSPSPPPTAVRRRRLPDGAAPSLSAPGGGVFILARHAASLRSRGDVFQYGPEVYTAGGCEALCARTKECNAWRFCADAAKGCGAGCLAFASSPSSSPSSFPRNRSGYTFEEGKDCGPWPDAVCRRVAARLVATNTTTNSSPSPPPPHLPHPPLPPFDALGPYNLGFMPPEEAYGYTGKCRGGEKAARFTDRWAQGVCTLLRVRDAAALLAAPASSAASSAAANPAALLDKGRGWIGGIIETPAKCANVSADMCERCAVAAKNAQKKQKTPGFGVAAAEAGEAACLSCAARRTLPAWDVITGHDMVRVECQGAEEQQQRRREEKGRREQAPPPPFQVRSSCGAEAAALDCTVSREAEARRCAGFGPEDAAKLNEKTCRFVWPQADGASRPLF